MKKMTDTWGISDLEESLKGMTFPVKEIRIMSGITIVDCAKFVDSHLAIVKAQNGKKTYLPYLERLIQFKNML